MNNLAGGPQVTVDLGCLNHFRKRAQPWQWCAVGRFSLIMPDSKLDPEQLKAYTLALPLIESKGPHELGNTRRCKPEELIRLSSAESPGRWVVAAHVTYLNISAVFGGLRVPLAIDPDWAGTEPPSIAHILNIAQLRRDGLWKYYPLLSWGYHIGHFVSLQKLNLWVSAIGTTGCSNQIATCAETWTCPITQTAEMWFRSKSVDRLLNGA